MNKNVDFLIRKIKSKTGLDREAIAKRINYSRTRLSKLTSENDERIYDLLDNEFKKELKDEISSPDMGNNEDILILSASVKMLYNEVAILKAKNEKTTKSLAFKLMREQTNSILNELF